MVEEQKECPQILIQFAAVREALNKTARIVFEDHLETCLKQAVKSGETEQYLTDLKQALSRFL
jgi:DNA-binding FrmR family transcriptional regulator